MECAPLGLGLPILPDVRFAPVIGQLFRQSHGDVTSGLLVAGNLLVYLSTLVCCPLRLPSRHASKDMSQAGRTF